MKIKQLIKELNKLDPNLEVILSSDMEGNYFHKLDEISIDDSTVFNEESGEFIDVEDCPNGLKCVVLFP